MIVLFVDGVLIFGPEVLGCSQLVDLSSGFLAEAAVHHRCVAATNVESGLGSFGHLQLKQNDYYFGVSSFHFSKDCQHDTAKPD